MKSAVVPRLAQIALIGPDYPKRARRSVDYLVAGHVAQASAKQLLPIYLQQQLYSLSVPAMQEARRSALCPLRSD